MEISRGAQFKVFDMRDGRVRKVPLSPTESQAVIKSWYEPGEAPASELAINYYQLGLAACKRIKTLLDEYPELAPSMGNPVFEERGVYTQDKATLLGEALRQSSTTRPEALLDGYTDLIVHHWRYGLSEQSFNCTVNNGVDTQGRVVLLDLGEVSFNKAAIKSNLALRRWLRSFSYNRDMPAHVQAYYLRNISRKITPQTLDANWKQVLKK